MTTQINNNHKEVNGTIYKSCKICGEWFIADSSNFYKLKTSPDGISPYCKSCAIKKSAKYIKGHQKEQNKYKRIAYKNDQNNIREKTRSDSKKRRESGECLAWQQNNKDKIKQYINTREQNRKHTISKQEWIECKEYFNNSCAYCGLPIEEHYRKYRGIVKLGDLHKEHVNYDGKNDLSNCVPSCKVCNSLKHTFPLNGWYNKDNPVYTYERYHKIYLWIRYDYKDHRKIYINKNVAS